MSDAEEDPPTPPFEAGVEAATDPETVRERVRNVAATLTDEQDVATIADMADCSKEGARSALREYADLGLVRRTNENPERYERNGAFFRFRRGLDLAERHSEEQLIEEYLALKRRHESFGERFDVGHPREVEYDERTAPEQRDDVSEWHGVIERAADIREAYWQVTRESLPPVDASESADEEADVETATVEDLDLDPDAVATALAGTPAAATLSVEILRLLLGELQSNEELRRLLSDLDSDDEQERGSPSPGSADPR